MSSSDSPFLNDKRLALFRAAGQMTEKVFSDHKARPEFRDGEQGLDAIIKDYRQLRHQFAQNHGIGDEGLLANHKVAALYVWVLTRLQADTLFLFPEGTPSNQRRAVLASFMYNLIYGVLLIDPREVDQDLHEDLEYCLLKEPPENLEWLCVTMHAMCRLHGTPSNTKV